MPCCRFDPPGLCFLWILHLRQSGSSSSRSMRQWKRKTRELGCRATAIGVERVEKGGIGAETVCPLQMHGLRLVFGCARGAGVLCGGCPDSRKATLVCFRFAAFRTTRSVLGPMRHCVGWQSAPAPLGPDGCGWFEGSRWRCPYLCFYWFCSKSSS